MTQQKSWKFKAISCINAEICQNYLKLKAATGNRLKSFTVISNLIWIFDPPSCDMHILEHTREAFPRERGWPGRGPYSSPLLIVLLRPAGTVHTLVKDRPGGALCLSCDYLFQLSILAEGAIKVNSRARFRTGKQMWRCWSDKYWRFFFLNFVTKLSQELQIESKQRKYHIELNFMNFQIAVKYCILFWWAKNSSCY